MEQNQNTDNDLQKAIDDITNKTNIDPVFSDPVAAPSSVPEGDTGELGEAVGPFPEPPKPEPIAPAPELSTPTEPLPTMSKPQPTQEQTIPAPTTEPISTTPEAQNTPDIASSSSELNVRQIKDAALRDLVPLLNRLNMTPTQKFHIYRDIFENLRDYTVLEPAYRAAKDIPDDTERAEALLYLVESIDKM